MLGRHPIFCFVCNVLYFSTIYFAQHRIKPWTQDENRVPASGYIVSYWLETLRISTYREVPEGMSVHLIVLSGLKRHIGCTVRQVDWVNWFYVVCGSFGQNATHSKVIRTYKSHYRVGIMRDRLGHAGARFKLSTS
jgi:hypothetical protein